MSFVSRNFPLDPSGCAARQSPKLLEVYKIRWLGDEVRVEEVLVGEFIIAVVVNIGGHIRIKHS
jgi:hypothetical protein